MALQIQVNFRTCVDISQCVAANLRKRSAKTGVCFLQFVIALLQGFERGEAVKPAALRRAALPTS